MKLLILSICLLSITAAQAQQITDPQQAIAARDTLLHEADHLLHFVQQASAPYQTNAVTRGKRRVVVWGQMLSTPSYPLEKRLIQWRQVTRYRRNGRVQQYRQVTLNGRILMRQELLNSHTIWLVITRPLPGTQDKLPRHLGNYLASGFVTLDSKRYLLPRVE
ncbi:hypothetical protein FNT36_17310 [Hymenobacter setariae]|uniref:Uncharacterized protein n=1 Tax=Hymenobacter setariae TaxID=2594794 RepID=A0A558BSB6_9BACT|nr:hypothetical protein [Hymenobacter setariae]TVT39410.1 hypothetical protein FNT36_17310 [Hymenobacter setariae]